MVKTIPSKPVWALALFIGGVLNLSVWSERLASVYASASRGTAWLGGALELLLPVAVTAALLWLAALFGRRALQMAGTLVLLISVLCAYFMVRFDVVIGYGVVKAVLTTDHAMSGEVVGGLLVAWVVVLAGLPAWWFLRMTGWLRPGHAEPPVPRARRRALVWLVVALVAALALLAGLRRLAQQVDGHGLNASFTGVVAHSYLPTNWLAGTAMVVGNALTAWRDDATLVHPAERHRYLPTDLPEDLQVVVVIGESARWDHFGVLGHHRPTTPRLQAEQAQGQLAAFRATSCDTSTKLSLACMFVRAAGVMPGDGLHQRDEILEQSVFAVLRSLGFSIDLFAMQGEAGFYQHVHPDFYKLREVIAAEAGSGVPDLDGLLVPQVARALEQRGAGRRAIVLHTKGSHYLYSRRYPAEQARWQPVCDMEHRFCSRDELLNAYDNSILYTDRVLGELFDTLREKRAVVLYTADHGESIGENSHFHATPRAIAPPEQLRVPLLLWASPSAMADPGLGPGLRRAVARAQVSSQAPSRRPADLAVTHHHLFSTLLGCAGVRSPDGGLEAGRDLCAQEDRLSASASAP